MDASKQQQPGAGAARATATATLSHRASRAKDGHSDVLQDTPQIYDVESADVAIFGSKRPGQYVL